MEFVWITVPGTNHDRVFWELAGLAFRKSRLSGNLSATVFDTDDYDTRIYIYRPDLLYNFSLPAYYGKGLNYFLNLHQDLSSLIPQSRKHFHLSGWLKWSQTFYPGSVSIGTGLDEIKGNRKSEIKAQILLEW